MRACPSCQFLVEDQADTCRFCGAAVHQDPGGQGPAVTSSGPMPPGGGPAAPVPGSAFPGGAFPGTASGAVLAPPVPPVPPAPKRRSPVLAVVLGVVLGLTVAVVLGVVLGDDDVEPTKAVTERSVESWIPATTKSGRVRFAMPGVATSEAMSVPSEIGDVKLQGYVFETSELAYLLFEYSLPAGVDPATVNFDPHGGAEGALTALGLDLYTSDPAPDGQSTAFTGGGVDQGAELIVSGEIHWVDDRWAMLMVVGADDARAQVSGELTKMASKFSLEG